MPERFGCTLVRKGAIQILFLSFPFLTLLYFSYSERIGLSCEWRVVQHVSQLSGVACAHVRCVRRLFFTQQQLNLVCRLMCETRTHKSSTRRRRSSVEPVRRQSAGIKARAAVRRPSVGGVSTGH